MFFFLFFSFHLIIGGPISLDGIIPLFFALDLSISLDGIIPLFFALDLSISLDGIKKNCILFVVFLLDVHILELPIALLLFPACTGTFICIFLPLIGIGFLSNCNKFV